MFVNIIEDNILTSEEGSNRKIERIIQWGTAVSNFDHVLRPRLQTCGPPDIGEQLTKKPLSYWGNTWILWTWPPLSYYCGNTCTSDRLYVANVTGEDFVRQANIRIFDHMTYYCKIMDASGPVRRQFDMPKSEYIDVLACPVPSGLQAGPKAEYYHCYRVRPKSEYSLSTRPDPKPHTICATRPDPNPNIFRATSQTRTRILFVLLGHQAREDL